MIKAKTNKGTEVYCYIHEDCGNNKGGFYVEICLNEDCDRFDDIVIHPSDCDCSNTTEVDNFIVNHIAKITDY